MMTSDEDIALLHEFFRVEISEQEKIQAEEEDGGNDDGGGVQGAQGDRHDHVELMMMTKKRRRK